MFGELHMSFLTKSKKIGVTLRDKAAVSIKFLNRHSWLLCLIIGFILNFTAECLHRHSFVGGVMHIVNSPLPFLFNVLIIATVFSLCTLFRRRYFFWAFFFCLFLAFGIANCVLLNLRVTPLEWADLRVVKISLITKYLNTFQIILAFAPIVLAIIGLIIFFIKCPKVKVEYLKNSLVSLVYLAVLTVNFFTLRASDVLLSQHTKDLAKAYKDYGFYYCFLCSVFDSDMEEPAVYTGEDVKAIVAEVTAAAEKNETVKEQASIVQNDEKAPNVIFLQLETFFDVNHLSNVEFSENPIPNFTKLHSEYSSGYIAVPSLGAGTANTEFEVISGMSLGHFGIGAYPYTDVLQNTPCESICYGLKNHGYATHAIHNNTAVFYSRNKVFANFGFDTFTSIEYMQNVEFTESGWAKDDVMLSSIADCLDSTESPDLIYAITVQAHGKYPSSTTDKLPIEATGFSDDETINSEFNYYINQLNQVDTVIGQLLELLSERDERTVVVMYGDHLPSFDISPEDLDGGDLFKTEYLIWDNFGLKTENEDINAYQLSSKVLGLLGNDDGILTKLHQNFKDSENYQVWLKTLQYDMLRGEQYTFGGKANYPYKAANLKLGIKEISISDVERDEQGILTVTGDNFTPFSKISINDKLVDTVLTEDNSLKTKGQTAISAGDYLSVVQVSSNGTTLSSSKSYLIGGTHEKPTVTVKEENENTVVYVPRGLKTSTAVAIIVAGIAVILTASAVILVTVLKRRKTK